MNSITIPNSVLYIGENAFECCRNLTTVVIPNSITSIGQSTFRYCEGLLSVVIPNTITTIGIDAFYYCNSLTSVTIPKSVTYIDEDAFYCKSLQTIYALPEVPSTLNEEKAFKGAPEDAIVYVPKGKIEAYSSAAGWDYFSDFREIEGEAQKLEIEAADSKNAEYYHLNGLRANALPPRLIYTQAGR